MPKLTAAQLDAWANAWHDYLDVVLERRRRAKSAAQEAFEMQAERNAAELERRRTERWGKARARSIAAGRFAS